MREEGDKCQDGKIWRCRKTVSGQRHQTSTSLRHHSYFSQSNLALKEAIYLLYEWSVNTPLATASYELAISEKTVAGFYKSCRQTSSLAVETRLSVQIGGEGDVVEIDECQLGRRKAHRGRIPREVWVLGGLVRGSNPVRCFLEVVRSRNAETLLEVIQRRVHQSSHICNNGWAAYSALRSLGYTHNVVNHSENFISPFDVTVHTQNIENFWCCLRRFLRSKGTYTRRNLSGYMNEFIYRKSFIDTFETTISLMEDMVRRNSI
jgi:hypothetical protein